MVSKSLSTLCCSGSHFALSQRNFGFSSSAHDFALFIRKTECSTILLLLYVDDMIITRDDIVGISSLKQFLHRQFEMKDLGALSYFLGLEISQDSSGYFLTQAKYTSDLLAPASLSDCKTVLTPVDPQTRLTPLDGPLFQFIAVPRSPHYAALVRILRYLKGTLFHGLHYSPHSSLQLHAFSDADWAGDPTDRRSTTGFCFFLAATNLYCDNQSAIQIAHNDVFHDRTKHIEIDCHFI
ncbi:uncharacterized protein LOC114319109 [Camellia sinensis]|uniref:uncharacterized protein LOC114319109 n=1 Tax=Camellia sinensis TaxID=4442 RepID=UPI0010362542|nr:uncharacterized protein LOC114319109 [Camellia sinensis]